MIALAWGQGPKLIRSLDHAQLTVGPQHLRADDSAIRDPAQELVVSDSPRGAAASALLYSLIETAKANGREPYRLSPRAVREAAPRPHPRRLYRAPPHRPSAAAIDNRVRCCLARQGDRVRPGTVAKADPLPRSPAAYGRTQHRRADDPAVRDPAQELAVPAARARPPRAYCSTLDRGRQGERLRTVPVSPRAVRQAVPCPHPRRLSRASPQLPGRPVTAIDTWIRHPLTDEARQAAGVAVNVGLGVIGEDRGVDDRSERCGGRCSCRFPARTWAACDRRCGCAGGRRRRGRT